MIYLRWTVCRPLFKRKGLYRSLGICITPACFLFFFLSMHTRVEYWRPWTMGGQGNSCHWVSLTSFMPLATSSCCRAITSSEIASHVLSGLAFTSQDTYFFFLNPFYFTAHISCVICREAPQSRRVWPFHRENIRRVSLRLHPCWSHHHLRLLLQPSNTGGPFLWLLLATMYTKPTHVRKMGENMLSQG